MSRRSAGTGSDRRPASATIVKVSGQQWREDGEPQRANPCLGALLAMWENRIAEGDTPTGSDLADLLAANGPGALPAWLVDHLCSYLRSQDRNEPGPKSQFPLNVLEIASAAQRYRELLAWLQKRKRSQGLNGWSCIREADWWQGPPHERAKRMIRRRSRRFRRVGIGRLANIMSSRKWMPSLRE